MACCKEFQMTLVMAGAVLDCNKSGAIEPGMFDDTIPDVGKVIMVSEVMSTTSSSSVTGSVRRSSISCGASMDSMIMSCSWLAARCARLECFS